MNKLKLKQVFIKCGELYQFKDLRYSKAVKVVIQKRVYSNESRRPTLTLYTKTPCPLCDEAMHALEPLLNQVVLEKVDITESGQEKWWQLYKHDIPVFHFQGRFLMKHKADKHKLQKAIKYFHKNEQVN